MTMPRVTALIDTYNQGRFVEEAIESALSQDFPASDMEILVVDDGSTDDTRSRVEKFGGRVRYLWKPNGGQASALNLGFEQARGEIVAPLDGDDVWLPQKVRRIVEEFERHPEAAVVYHPYIYWDPEQNTSDPDTNFYPVTGRMPLETKALLRYGSYGTCSMALRRGAVAALFPIPTILRVFADTYLVMLLPFIGNVVGVPEPLTRYRQHGSNLTAFQLPEHERVIQRWKCSAAAAEEGKRWLLRHSFNLSDPGVAEHITRNELVGRMQEFHCRMPGRGEYFQYLRDLHNLYLPLWPARYRVFRSALTFLGLVLGYRRFESLREHYRRAGWSACRGKWFPAGEIAPANSETQKAVS
jgi:glycosyltransferase involved in cell wall biosynthesis